MTFYKGDIILPSNRTYDKTKLLHPAVVWSDVTDGNSDFIGIMLTSAVPTKKFNNIAMAQGHFAQGFLISYKQSHFVNQLFVKYSNWGPFDKVGELTAAGIKFIEDNISSTSVVPFDVYILR